MTDILPAINQRKWAELNLECSLTDLAILNWMISFAHSSEIVTLVDNGITYYWFKASKIIEDLPILGIKTKRVIDKHIDTLIKEKLIIRYDKNESLGRSYFRFGRKLDEYISTPRPKSHTLDQKDEGGGQKSQGSLTFNNIDNNNIKESNNINIITKESEELDEHEVQYYKVMQEKYPNIQSMTKPLTYAEYSAIVNEYRDMDNLIIPTMQAMENCAKLKKEYISANLTLRNWLRRRKANGNK